MKTLAIKKDILLIYDFEKDDSLKYLVVWKNGKIISHVRFECEDHAIAFATYLNVSAHVYLTIDLTMIFANGHSSFYGEI